MRLHALLACLWIPTLAACGAATATVDPGPSAGGGCRLAPSTPTPLLATAIPKGRRVQNLTLADGHLYFNDDDNAGASTGALARVATAGGAREAVVDSPVGGFAVGGGTVAWSPREASAVPGGVSYSNTKVLVRDAAGATHTITPPPDTTPTRLMIDSTGSVLFRVDASASTELRIMRWDAATRTATERLRMPTFSSGFYLDADRLYWFDTTKDGTTIVYAAESAGTAAPVELARVPDFGTLVGFDADRILYSRRDPALPAQLDAPETAFTLAAVPKAGGEPTAIFTSPLVASPVATMVDPTSVLWLDEPDHASDATLYRAPLTGGPAIRVAQVPGARGAGSLAQDACNMYYARSLPDGTTQVMAVAK